MKFQINRSWVTLLALFVIMQALSGTCFAQVNLFTKPTGDGTNIWKAVLTALQYIFFAAYILAAYWALQAAKDWKDGDQKAAWQKIGGALGIFLAPAFIQLLKYIGSLAGGSTQFGA
jgi:hypothetical protein